uniref:LIN9_C domain-containing protein n=1 Tax=Caenorhabditis tropicalis TaxID=1561998 RepID=A0A1I7U633_9PELO
MGTQKISAIDLQSLGDVIGDIRNQIHPRNVAFFQDYVEVHLKQFHTIMIESGALSGTNPSSSSASGGGGGGASNRK